MWFWAMIFSSKASHEWKLGQILLVPMINVRKKHLGIHPEDSMSDKIATKTQQNAQNNNFLHFFGGFGP